VTLILMRGYPGSGKTTLAQKWVADDEANRRRVNRDDIRHMLFGRYTDVDEVAVTKAQKALVETFLRQRKDVVVDDTNLRLRTVKDWVQVAHRHAHQVEIVDVETGPSECMMRDDARQSEEKIVGGRVINDFAKRYPMPWPKVDLPEVKEPDFRPYASPYVWDGPVPSAAIIVDLDGTLAVHQGRSPYDYSKVLTDRVNDTVYEAMMDFAKRDDESDPTIIFLSGRPDSCRDDTLKWLTSKVGSWTKSAPLLMRKAGDDRADYVVKYEIFEREIRDKYDVRLVLDDRDQVVDMWRAIGLPTWQVARGDF
jgi:predicted kinase